MSRENFMFSQVPTANIPRSAFNRSHGYKTTFDAGYLIPFYVDEALPGDTFSVRASMFGRLTTPVVPVMDNIYLDVFFFAVPNRLMWANWQKFMGEQENPGDSTDYLLPQVDFTDPGGGGIPEGSLGDYFGLPTKKRISVNAFPFRAYNRIYNDWFRDQNLIDAPNHTVSDGPDDPENYPLRRRAKRHDYFTSCMPWPQKGPGVELPLGNSAPVVTVGAPTWKEVGDNTNTGYVYQQPDGSLGFTGPRVANAGLMFEQPNMVADLSDATAATINSLRQAFQIQKLLERDARGGTRYIEILRSHFGVVSPDARLQRAEYLGGGSVAVNINPVVQTSAVTGQPTPKGSLAAFGVVGASGIGFSKSFVEHCTILGLVNARADINYQQGLDKMWSRRTRFDFYWPAFANLGEQAVLGKEIYCEGDSAAGDDEVFGYQERWAEYRYFPNKVTGKFRSNATGTLEKWHLAQQFGSRPVLGQTFIEDNPPIERVVAVPSEPHFLLDCHLSIKAVRPMPVYSVPGMIDHF